MWQKGHWPGRQSLPATNCWCELAQVTHFSISQLEIDEAAGHSNTQSSHHKEEKKRQSLYWDKKE